MGAPEGTEVRETHIGVVLLMGDRAFKFKKPVRLPFLDFSTPDRRRAVCGREVELNRRMAPDVYLGVADLVQPDGRVEPVVAMRRMRDQERLSALVRAGADVSGPLRGLARSLAALHARSDHDADIDHEGAREQLAARWASGFDEVRAHADELLDGRRQAEIERLVSCYLAGRGPLFAARIDDGCIVDGHGDLIADDIFCTVDGPRALDCLEFDDRLRYLDRIDDAACLAMDLEHLGAPAAGRYFLDTYRELADDRAPDSLVHHYIAYRAYVRAKVASVRYAQGDRSAGALVDEYAAIAVRHLREHEVHLVLVGGPPGTGKTTVAGMLADERGAVLLSSDRIRKELAGIDPLQPAPAEWQSELYAPERTASTYADMLRRAALLLGRGESVVLDASWSAAGLRSTARELGSATASTLVEIRCDCPPDEAARRMRGRSGPSDADVEVARRLRDVEAPWPTAHQLDTTGTAAEVAVRASGLLAEEP